jgi:MraZ protein
MLLTGTFRRSVDAKQRIAVPKRLRSAMEGQGLYLAPGTDGSLSLYPEKAFTRMADRLSESSPAGQDVRAFSRLFFAQAEGVEADSQGRFRVPPTLFEQAGLKDEVVLIGVRDHIEIWDVERWDAYFAAKQENYDQIAEKAFEAG